MPIELVTGDITDQPDLDAVVNAANAQLMPGGGVAGAIHRAAGPELAEACHPLAPIEPGQAVITRGFNLPNDWVIHVLGPRYGIDEPADELLARAYRNALRLCGKKALKSVGFPALSAGAFGYPLAEAADIALRTVGESAPEGLLVRFVLFDEATLRVFREQAGQSGRVPPRGGSPPTPPGIRVRTTAVQEAHCSLRCSSTRHTRPDERR